MGNQRKKTPGFLTQGIILAAASIIVRLIGLVYRIPLTNILGDEGNAFYSNAFEVYNIALLLSSYSIPLAVSKLVSARKQRQEHTNSYRVFKSAMIFTAIIGIIVSLLVYFGADFISSTLMKMPMSSYALKVLSPCLFIVAVLGVVRGYFQGLGTTVPTAVSQVLEQIVNAVVSIVAASYLFKVGGALIEAKNNALLDSAYGAAGGTLGTVAGAFTALLFMGLVFAAYYGIIKKKMLREEKEEQEVESYQEIIKVLVLTIIPVVMSTAIYNINSIIDQSVYNNIIAMQGYTQEEYASLWGMFTGKYKVLLNVPLGISSALAVSVIPSLTAAVAIKKRRLVHERIGMAIRFAMLIAMPSFVAFAVFASPILQLLFGDARKTPAWILSLGALAIIVFCLSTITNAILQGINQMTKPIHNALISLGIHLVVLLVLMVGLKWNIFAIVISNIVFGTSMCILNSIAIRRSVKYHQEIKTTFVLPFISAVIMGVVSYVFYLLFRLFLSPRIALLPVMLIAGIVYVVCLFLTKALTETEVLAMPKGHKLVDLFKKFRLL